MKKVIYSMMVSLDASSKGRNETLTGTSSTRSCTRSLTTRAREAGAFVYGRRLYAVMVDYWPTADAKPSAPEYEVEFARIWKDKPKIVFSKTLDEVEWNSRLVRDNIAEEITRLKEQPGEDLALGGANLASAVMQLGLIDEYRPIVHPVVLGGGTPFFPRFEIPIKLRLVETRTFESGVVYLRYERANGERAG